VISSPAVTPVQSIWGVVTGGSVTTGGIAVGVVVAAGAQAANTMLAMMSKPINLKNLAFIKLFLLTISLKRINKVKNMEDLPLCATTSFYDLKNLSQLQ
jgi:hypothetical protein